MEAKKDYGADFSKMKGIIESHRLLDRAFIDERGVVMIRFNGGRKTQQARFGVRTRDRILLPIELAADAMKICHSSGLGEHMGI